MNNYISPKIVNSLQIPWKKKSLQDTYQVYYIKGVKFSYNNSYINIETDQLSVEIERHKKLISFDLIDIYSSDILLGYP